VSKAFTPRAVEDLKPRIQEIVDELLDRVEAQKEFDLVEALAYPTPVIVIAEMLGVPAEDRPRFKHWSDTVVATLSGPFTPPDVMEQARQSLMELAEYLQAFIQDRRASPQSDLISGLVAAEERGDVLSEDEIMATTILLLIAGNETTTHLIANSVYALLTHRDQWDILRAEPGLMPVAVEEFLRFAGPVQLTGRVAMEDLEINGHRVDAGVPCTTLLGAANRDPAKFPDPDRFDVRRNPTEHVAFGDGIHFCLGAPLARAEAAIAIGTLISRFPGLQLRGEPEWGGTFIIRGIKKLPVGATVD
jgi:cytochrome P450